MGKDNYMKTLGLFEHAQLNIHYLNVIYMSNVGLCVCPDNANMNQRSLSTTGGGNRCKQLKVL